MRHALYKDIYEDTERVLIAKVVKPGMKVLEIGTGIGFISLLATRLAGDGNVVSFEANPELEPIIRDNFARNNRVPNLVMNAVTVDGQPISFFRSDNIISSSLYDRKRQDEKITVQSTALADILEQHDPNVLIMDVEGAEIDLLGAGSLKSIQHIIVEVHPHIVGDEKIALLLKSLEERGFMIKERIRKTAYLVRPA
ncbi:FkbM family methyltransferase [Pararhizobium antarcticum]|uniref:FkbM family methyltransferase n=1 Tax=Pararhizobium antarcticum TaxID=1798805 RepID=UPI001114D417|nr:FkbM family methyltransferase [Pararhizobium antarcticum]